MRRTNFNLAMSVLCILLAAAFAAVAGEADEDDAANNPAGEPPALTESVVVQAIRADDNAPVT